MVDVPHHIDEYEKIFLIDSQRASGFVHSFAEEMLLGLNTKGKGGDFMMLDSCVEELPTGKERGVFYAVDFGGTNLRIARVELGGPDGVLSVHQDKSSLAELQSINGLPSGSSSIDLKVTGCESCQDRFERGLLDKNAPASALFGRIALQIHETMRRFGDGSEQPVPLGFTFSFPITQHCLSSGVLGKWTKGFETGRATNDPVEGHDVGALLQRSLDVLGVRARVDALCNDTIGTLISALYEKRAEALKMESAEQVLLKDKVSLWDKMTSCFASCHGRDVRIQEETRAHSSIDSEDVHGDASSGNGDALPDAVSTNISSRQHHVFQDEVLIGMILGTGVNACYIQDDHSLFGYTGAVVNIEMGNFQIHAKADHIGGDIWRPEIDGVLEDTLKHSIPLRFQQLEKMMAGRHLGQLTRLVFRELCTLESIIPPKAALARFDSLESSDASIMFQSPEAAKSVKSVLEQEEAAQGGLFSERHWNLLCSAASLVFRRAAQLAALSLYSIAKFAVLHRGGLLDSTAASEKSEEVSECGEAPACPSDFPSLETYRLVAAIDGSLFSQNPPFVAEMERTLVHVDSIMQAEAQNPDAAVRLGRLLPSASSSVNVAALSPSLRIRLVAADDGSGKGAAIAVASVQRVLRKRAKQNSQ